MYTFSNNWFESNIPVWSTVLAHLVGKPCNALEIGAFEGAATVWLLENVLTHPSSRIVSIDPCTGNIEHDMDQTKDLCKSYATNVLCNFQKKARLVKTFSNVALMYPDIQTTLFDIIYIDGDHHAHAVLEDAVLAFRLLKLGGIMIFDDFAWPVYTDQPYMHPSTAVKAFVACYGMYVTVIHEDYQVILKKTSDI